MKGTNSILNKCSYIEVCIYRHTVLPGKIVFTCHGEAFHEKGRFIRSCLHFNLLFLQRPEVVLTNYARGSADILIYIY